VKLASRDGAFVSVTELDANQRKALSSLGVRPPKRLQNLTLSA
jgi:hypothetical protein